LLNVTIFFEKEAIFLSEKNAEPLSIDENNNSLFDTYIDKAGAK